MTPLAGRILSFSLWGVLVIGLPGFAYATPPPPDTLIIREALAITLPQRTPYSVLPIYPVAAWMGGGRMDAPTEGEPLRLANGSNLTWRRIVADSLGWFPEQPRGEQYVAVLIEMHSPAKKLLEGMGHDFALVNGIPRSGNPYQQFDEPDEPQDPHYGYSKIPVELQGGENLLLFRYTRGRLKIRLLPVEKEIAFNRMDITRPDGVVGKKLDSWGSVTCTNATSRTVRDLAMVSAVAGGRGDTIAVPELPVMGVRKVPFRIQYAAPHARGTLPVRLTLLGGNPRRMVLDTMTVRLNAVAPDEHRRETFVSAIDGTVQYYAVMPPLGESEAAPALFLSLHGAGVEAIGQAGSYSPKRWGYIVAPTNRRPYGFSWEDWGRLDALEVLDIVTKKYNIDENRVYLTGHSMGGHGSWFMGATYPDKFAAIGPSAGWITFRSYRFADAKAETTDVNRMFNRAASSSDLFSLAENYRHFGVYVIHGATDNNVPPQQSYLMLERLKPIHTDLVYYEQPGEGHWWDLSPEPGADCIDWKPLFDFFSRHSRPGPDRRFAIDFTTANPGISHGSGWLHIDAQDHPLEFSRAKLTLLTDLSGVRGTTSNVSRLSFDAKAFRPGGPLTVELDSQTIALSSERPSAESFWFEKRGGVWRQGGVPSPAMKNARRNGPFKEVFRNRMILVYGTAGSKEENAWAYNRARYDAEKLWYQGNSSVDVVADTDLDLAKDPDRNVILYGNARTNRLWKPLLSDSPVTVDKGRVTVGDKTLKGPDICCIFARPRPGSDVALVGVVSGTGIEGSRLSHLVMYLEPGVGLPDLAVFNRQVLKEGDSGVILTGFFGPDWGLQSGEFVGGATITGTAK